MSYTLLQQDIVRGLHRLGISRGDTLMVHASLGSLGCVTGGAAAVCDALIEACGREGTVVMPGSGPRKTSIGGDQPFDFRYSPSEMGAISEEFRKRPGVLRSVHPTHSVSARGPKGHRLIDGHRHAATGYGPETPYGRLPDIDAKILLLGCDQDRNTFLHTIEAAADLPYLRDIVAEYVDEEGDVVTSVVRQMAGPHRDFIGVDRVLREADIVRVGRIGRAVCRLMDARSLLDFLLPRLRRDPALLLCDNPSCLSCQFQIGKVRERQLAMEDLSVVTSTIGAGPSLDDLVRSMRCRGITSVEVSRVDGIDIAEAGPPEFERLAAAFAPLPGTALHPPMPGIRIASLRSERADEDVGRLAAMARRLGVPFITVPISDQMVYALRDAPDDVQIILENGRSSADECLEMVRQACVYQQFAGLAFNPAGFVTAGYRPFLDVLKGRIGRLRIRQVILWDMDDSGRHVPLGQGFAEVKEILSILRCRSYDGGLVLRGAEEQGLTINRQVQDAWGLLRSL